MRQVIDDAAWEIDQAQLARCVTGVWHLPACETCRRPFLARRIRRWCRRPSCDREHARTERRRVGKRLPTASRKFDQERRDFAG
jgi:hypothetical protein